MSDNMCNICAENIKGYNKEICCPYCEQVCCLNCFKNYLLNSEEPICMFPDCKKTFSLEYISTVTPKSFSDKYRSYRTDILHSRERSLLPATQELVVEEIAKRKNEEEKQSQIKELEEERWPLVMRLRDIDARLRVLKNSRYNDNEERKRDPGSKFVRPCSAEDCRGFLSTAWKCGTCERYTCSDCHELKESRNDEAHVCEEDKVATVRLLTSDSKPCPNCRVLITYIDGCFAPNTPVLTWTGETKLAKDIQVGDELVGDDGLKRTVQHTKSGVDQMYNIKQSNAEDYTVSSNHKLVVKFSSHKTIKWVRGKYYTIKWFDESDFTIKDRFFSISKMISKDKAYEQICKFRDILPSNDVFEITVNDFMKISSKYKKYFYNFKNNGDRSSIKIEPLGEGEYYGWEIDGNHRFLLRDFTVVRNCDQMWCTQCKTPFSWRTGRVVSGQIHNPHYFDYIRSVNNGVVPRNPLDRPCGGMPYISRVERTLRYRGQTETMPHLNNCIRIEAHIRAITMRSYTNTEDIDSNVDLRIKYLMNEIDEKKWKKNLQMRMKKREKNLAVTQVLEMFCDTLVDIFNGFVNRDIENLEEATTNLRLYATRELNKISRFYNNKVPIITPDWTVR